MRESPAGVDGRDRWRHGRAAGVVGAAVGATAGMFASFALAAPIADRASDNENGWFHDADGALIFVAALIVLAGIAAGSGLGVAALHQQRVLATTVVTVPAVVAVSIAMIALSVPSAATLAVPLLAASASRALVAPVAPATSSGSPV